MTRRRANVLVVLALLTICLPAAVSAGDETCRPIEVDWFSPSGVAGCTLDGPTDGVASVWGGDVAAANWCVFPWTDCGSVRVRSHQTGVEITVPVAMYCDCYWLSDRRLVDLTFGQVDALGLNPEAGLFDVTVTPLREGIADAGLPDTAVRP